MSLDVKLLPNYSRIHLPYQQFYLPEADVQWDMWNPDVLPKMSYEQNRNCERGFSKEALDW